MKFASAAACFAALSAALLALSVGSAAAMPGVVNTTVNLRQAPGTGNPVLAKIPGGAPVDVASCVNEWCQVTFAGKRGYIIASALGGPGGPPPPGYGPPPAVYVAPPAYYGPYYYGYGPGPYLGWRGDWGWRGGWHGGWGRRW
jgi:hypothetical protein